MMYTCLTCGQAYQDGYVHFCPLGQKLSPTPFQPTQWGQLPVYTAHGERICVEPFPPEEMKPKAVGKGFVTAEQKTTLKGLRVVIGNEKFPTGSTVFVSGEGYAQDWAKRVYTVDGMTFIFMPVSFVNFVRVGDPAPTAVTGDAIGV